MLVKFAQRNTTKGSGSICKRLVPELTCQTKNAPMIGGLINGTKTSQETFGLSS